MKPTHSFLFFFVSFVIPSAISAHAAHPPAAIPNAAHLAIGRRADAISTLTLFTPSPGADPIPITAQSQAVTSYVPIVGYPSSHLLLPFQRSKSLQTGLVSHTQKPHSTSPSPAPKRNTKTSLPQLTICPLPPSLPSSASASPLPHRLAASANTSLPPTNCSTSYTPTATHICHTTLSPLASPPIPITACTQPITFSTNHGYTLLASNKTQPIIDLTTLYAAPWAALTAGIPTQGIQVQICSTAPSAGCATHWEAWATSTGWVPETATVTVGPPVSVAGPALVVLHPALPTLTVRAGSTRAVSVETEVVGGRAVLGIGRKTMGAGDGSSTTTTTTTTRMRVVTRVFTLQQAGETGM